MSDKNKFGYKLDKYRQPICPSCNTPTNGAYAEIPNLTCWQCRAMMDGSKTQAEKDYENLLAIARSANECSKHIPVNVSILECSRKLISALEVAKQNPQMKALIEQ